MKKVILFLMIFAVSILVFGCREKAGLGMVVRAEIVYEGKDETIYRCYTQPEKLSGLLLQLRLQDFKGYAQIDPEQVTGDRCRIELIRDDGSRGVILQLDNRFRSTDSRRWEKVDKKQAEKLYTFLRVVPGDVTETWGWINNDRLCPAVVPQWSCPGFPAALL